MPPIPSPTPPPPAPQPPSPRHPPPAGHASQPLWRRPGAWLLALVAAPVVAILLGVLALSLFGANWARAPLAHWVHLQTGRTLQIAGDMRLGLGWPLLRVQVQGLRFANPAWAREPQMVEVDQADLQLDLRALLRGHLVLPTVAVGRPVVMLETSADGRKSWLLDRAQG